MNRAPKLFQCNVNEHLMIAKLLCSFSDYGGVNVASSFVYGCREGNIVFYFIPKIRITVHPL